MNCTDSATALPDEETLGAAGRLTPAASLDQFTENGDPGVPVSESGRAVIDSCACSGSAAVSGANTRNAPLAARGMRMAVKVTNAPAGEVPVTSSSIAETEPVVSKARSRL